MILEFIKIKFDVFGINIIVNNHILMKLLIEYIGYILFGVLSKLIFDRNHPTIIIKRVTYIKLIIIFLNKIIIEIFIFITL